MILVAVLPVILRCMKAADPDREGQAGPAASSSMRNSGASFSGISSSSSLLRIPSVLSLWNWKSALLSIILRVPVFAVATVRRGTGVLLAAVLVEALVCAFNAGCYAAVVQALRNRKPMWLTALIITIILPAIGQVIEYEAHRWHQTPHRVIAVIISSILSALSSLFNWYAMSQGTLLVGGERSSFSLDLRRLPGILGQFLLLVPRWLGRRFGDGYGFELSKAKWQHKTSSGGRREDASFH